MHHSGAFMWLADTEKFGFICQIDFTFSIATTGPDDECGAVSEPAEEEKQSTKGRNFAGDFSNCKEMQFETLSLLFL